MLATWYSTVLNGAKTLLKNVLTAPQWKTQRKYGDEFTNPLKKRIVMMEAAVTPFQSEYMSTETKTLKSQFTESEWLVKCDSFKNLERSINRVMKQMKRMNMFKDVDDDISSSESDDSSSNNSSSDSD